MYSKGLREHMTHVRQTLEILRQHQLYAKVSKCTFFSTQGRILGVMWSVLRDSRRSGQGTGCEGLEGA